MELIITCDEHFRKACEVSRDMRDTTLRDCFFRMMTWNGVAKVVIHKDFADYSFTFTTYNADGRVYICGGIIYHGRPEEGYQENGSVSINPKYGWQIHT